MSPEPAKGRRRQAKQDRSRDTVGVIIEAAARVLVREGYARATTNRIALEAGISVGSVYEYFRDKDDLFDALIRRQADNALAEIIADAPALKGPLEWTLRDLVFAALHAQRQYGPELYRQLEHVPNALLRRRLAEAKRHLTDYVRSLLETDRKRLRVSDLDLAAFVVVNAVEGIGYNAAPDMFNERLAEEVTTLLVRYLVDKPRTRRSVQSAANTGTPPFRQAARSARSRVATGTPRRIARSR